MMFLMMLIDLTLVLVMQVTLASSFEAWLMVTIVNIWLVLHRHTVTTDYSANCE